MSATPREARQAARPAEANPAVAPVQIRTGYRRFAGIRTRVLEAGPRPGDGSGRRGRHGRRARDAGTRPAGTRLVLLHGYCDSADTWRSVMTELAAQGHGVLAVDLPGFGEADALRPGPMLPQLDTFTAAVLREQSVLGSPGRGGNAVVLVGNSLGGTLGLRAAQQPRLPVAGVVSIAAPGFADSWLIRTVAKYPLPLRLYSSLPVPVPGFLVRAVAQQVVPRLLYADPGEADDAEVRRFTELFPDYRATTRRLEQARQLVAELAEAYQLDRVAAPLLVVACGKDRLVSAASGRQLHALVPHSRLLVQDDWGHCPQLDDPPAVAELVAYFAASSVAAHRRGVRPAGPAARHAAG